MYTIIIMFIILRALCQPALYLYVEELEQLGGGGFGPLAVVRINRSTAGAYVTKQD